VLRRCLKRQRSDSRPLTQARSKKDRTLRCSESFRGMATRDMIEGYRDRKPQKYL
jgi:hypothetical protein